MTFQTMALAFTVLGFAGAQYILCFQALRDLRRRARVRGNYRTLWALVILCLPIAGPLLYNWMGPTSFRYRPPSSLHDEQDVAPSNITPISAAPSMRNRSGSQAWSDPRPTSTPRSTGGRNRGNRTGS